MGNVKEKLMELAKRRGYFFQSSKAYGGAAGFFTFGPQGAALKTNIEDLWRERFTLKEGHKEIDAPTVMPEPVFEASGHLDGFDDMIIECPECSKSHRADHLIEDNTDIEEAESFSTEQVEGLIEEHGIECPNCGTTLSGVTVDDFNLMFKTNIGPGSSNPGYLRPETAQGIFVEFPRLKHYARNQLPFGITQIGRAYRNEISPRGGLLRLREFTQAELEHFIDPEEDEPRLEKVADVELKLYPEIKQGTGEHLEMNVEEAVEENVITSDWVAYYLGLAKRWYERIGVDMNRFRFRQHQSGELAHYASDCWDAESEIDGDWIELSGFAFRGCYDLSKHDEYGDDEFTIFREYDEPVVKEETVVQPDMGYLGPEYGNKAGEIVSELEELAENNPDAFDSENVSVEVDGEEIEVPVDRTGFEQKEVKKTGEHITPSVVEPSFGVDRIVYTVLAHGYDEEEIDGEERKVLHLDSEVAPTEVGVFPLMDKDGMGEKARDVAAKLREAGFAVQYDDTGNIGKRYRRQDEIGTPVCVTVDHETLEDGDVTIRDRDSTEQVRVDLDELEPKLDQVLDGAGIKDL
jgi:glycyl-tRNA synthetase